MHPHFVECHLAELFDWSPSMANVIGWTKVCGRVRVFLNSSFNLNDLITKRLIATPNPVFCSALPIGRR